MRSCRDPAELHHVVFLTEAPLRAWVPLVLNGALDNVEAGAPLSGFTNFIEGLCYLHSNLKIASL